MSDRSITACDACGQKDDHPKLHLYTKSWHHDCVPVDIKNSILGSVEPDAAEKLRSIFHVNTRGLKGDELLAHITKIHGKA